MDDHRAHNSSSAHQSCKVQRLRMQWSMLPQEIRLKVLEMIAQDSGPGFPVDTVPTNNPRRENGLARYTTVCKEWQAFFEKMTFARVTLDSSDLKNSVKFFPHRQKGLIKHLSLRIEIMMYECEICTPSGVNAGHWAARYLTPSRAISRLFRELSTWRSDEVAVHDDGQVGFTLEISIYISDMYRLPGRESRCTTVEDIERLSANFELDFSWWGLETVEVVRGLVLPRQTRRNLSHAALRQIFRCLPNVENITYEPWREYLKLPGKPSKEYFWSRDMVYQQLYLPGSLKTLTIFEDFIEDHSMIWKHNSTNSSSQSYLEPIRIPSPCVGEALASRSVRLEKLYASYMIDAKDFFHPACRSDWVWDKLTSLALTSRILTPQQASFSLFSCQIDYMLLDAAAAAIRMPALRTMEIWNGMKRNACVFSYRVTETSTTLGWCGTWNFCMSAKIIDAWKLVALLHTRRELCILPNESLVPDDITSHAVAIQQLKLDHVIHPKSLQQMLTDDGDSFPFISLGSYTLR